MEIRQEAHTLTVPKLIWDVLGRSSAELSELTTPCPSPRLLEDCFTVEFWTHS